MSRYQIYSLAFVGGYVIGWAALSLWGIWGAVPGLITAMIWGHICTKLKRTKA